MSDERQSRDEGPGQDPVGAYEAPTLTVHGKMVALTAQGTKPGRENQGNVRGRRPA